MSDDPNKRRPEAPRPAKPGPGATPVDVKSSRSKEAPRPASQLVPAPKQAARQSAVIHTSARPARPQSPTRPAAGPRLEGVLENDNQDVKSVESLMPSGLSISTHLPSGRRDPELERRLRIRRGYQFRQTILPSALVLTASMLLMAGGWFLLDPSSALRDNALGVAIPLTLLLLAIAFCIASLLLVVQSSALREQVEREGMH